MYKKAHAAIRENPVHEKKPPKEVKKKRWEMLLSINLFMSLWLFLHSGCALLPLLLLTICFVWWPQMEPCQAVSGPEERPRCPEEGQLPPGSGAGGFRLSISACFGKKICSINLMKSPLWWTCWSFLCTVGRLFVPSIGSDLHVSPLHVYVLPLLHMHCTRSSRQFG